jgi:cytoskeletal protein CcmA (bactofilin family)
MALSWFDRKRQDSGEWTGFLEQGVKLEGRLESTGTFRIDCATKGTLVSDQTLILGENAIVEGEIEGNYIIIAGRFEGIVRAKGKVELQAKAIVVGEIHTSCLVMEPGALFDGRCHMLSVPQAASAIVIPIRSVAARA